MNIILSNMHMIDDQKTLIHQYLKYYTQIKHNSYFWNIILGKKIYNEKLLELPFVEEIICKVIEDGLKHKKYADVSNPGDLMPFINDNVVFNLEKEKFMISHFYKDRILITKLIAELQKEHKSYEIIDHIFNTLESNNRYREGLVFDSSYISIERNSKQFCLYCVFYQYETHGTQSLFRLESDSYKLDISLKNGKLFKTETVNESIEHSYLKEDNDHSNRILMGIKLAKDVMTVRINETKHRFHLEEYKRIIIGKDFKGVLNKLLYYENSNYDAKYLSEKSRSEYYISFLVNLEKNLLFQNEKGFYLDSLNPFFINKKIDLDIKNVFVNENLYWLENGRLRDVVFEDAIKNNLMKDILDKYISQALTNISTI